MPSSTPSGSQRKSLLIRIDKRFDISSTRQILRAIRTIRSNSLEKVVIDLNATQHLHDSGMALLLLMHQQAGRLRGRIYLINCCPEIRDRLWGLSIGPLLHIA